MKNVFRLLNYVPRIWRYVAIVISLSITGSLIMAIGPYTFKVIIDELSRAAGSGITTQSQQVIILAVLALGGTRIFSAIFMYFSELISNRMFQTIGVSLRNTVFEKLTQLSIEYFEKNRSGEVVSKATSYPESVARWIYNISSGLLPQLTTMGVSAILIFAVSIPAGLIITAAMVLYFAQQMPMLRRTRGMMREIRKLYEKSVGYVQETVSHIAMVRSFGGEPGAMKQNNLVLQTYKTKVNERYKMLQANILRRHLVNSLAVMAGIGFVAEGALQGRHTTGDIILVALYMQQITSNIGSIGRFIIDSAEIDVTAERVLEMLDTKPDIVNAHHARPLEGLKTVEFKNVSFAYPGKTTKVLENVSFKIEPGQTFALVGRSGVGKTTITKLLLRFYEPTGGKILINGNPIENFTQESVRQHIGVVMQDVALFNDSIEANLHLANPKALKSEVKAAAIQAHADVFIERLPEKYKTLVGERGVKLSGGEKQRVAVARAILKDPQLIILDEATSALDSQSEQHVQAGLKQLLNGRTALVIAHRLSTVMRADQILVLENGRVTEQGTHSELLSNSGGIYANLFKIQSGALTATS